jgi:prevent-host-death family protein
MLPKKQVSLVEARASLSRLTQEVARGGGPVAIMQRSKLAAVLVNAERYKQDMAELEHYRRQRRKVKPRSFFHVMEIVGVLVLVKRQLAEE